MGSPLTPEQGSFMVALAICHRNGTEWASWYDLQFVLNDPFEWDAKRVKRVGRDLWRLGHVERVQRATGGWYYYRVVSE